MDLAEHVLLNWVQNLLINLLINLFLRTLNRILHDTDYFEEFLHPWLVPALHHGVGAYEPEYTDYDAEPEVKFLIMSLTVAKDADHRNHVHYHCKCHQFGY